jgi:hypothetical protein
MPTNVYVAISTTSKTGDSVIGGGGATYAATFSDLHSVYADGTYGDGIDLTPAGNDWLLHYDFFEDLTISSGTRYQNNNTTMSETNFLIMRPAPGLEHEGLFNTGVKITWLGDYISKLYLHAYTQIQDLVLEISASQGSNNNQMVLNDNAKMYRCLYTGYAINTSTNSVCIGNVCWNVSRGFKVGDYSGGKMYNNTVINATAYGFEFPTQGASAVIVKNNIVINATIADYQNTGYGSLTANNNASSDATAPGANSITNIVSASEVEDSVNGDGHLKAGNSLETAGEDLSGDLGAAWLDIDGQPFTGFPIGADQPGSFTVPLNIVALDAETLQGIPGVAIYVYATAGGPATEFDMMGEGVTDSNGELAITPAFDGIQPGIVQGRKGTTAPFYREGKSIFDLTGDGADVEIYMVLDQDDY